MGAFYLSRLLFHKTTHFLRFHTICANSVSLYYLCISCNSVYILYSSHWFVYTSLTPQQWGLPQIRHSRIPVSASWEYSWFEILFNQLKTLIATLLFLNWSHVSHNMCPLNPLQQQCDPSRRPVRSAKGARPKDLIRPPDHTSTAYTARLNWRFSICAHYSQDDVWETPRAQWII